MRKNRKNMGFTMAELLIVIAIIGVLSGVAFVAVQSHQRSMNRLERDAIAKELFVAAQNHLTMAKAQNYNLEGEIDYEDEAFFGSGIAYPVSDGGEAERVCALRYDGSSAGGNMLEVMLPFGAIEETVRAGGRYLILYQPKAARVLDVFYWEPNGRYGGSAGGNDALIAMRGNENASKTARLEYRNGGKNVVIGWFGGDGVLADTGEFLEAPKIEVVNAERLYVNVEDTNSEHAILQPQLKLILKGETSNVMAAVKLNGASGSRYTYDLTRHVYSIILDSVTQASMHFSEINDNVDNDFEFRKTDDDGTGAASHGAVETERFIPGEDITIYAVAYSNDVLTSIAYSSQRTTNSLFGGLRAESDGTTTALIGNIRHLENLDENISRLNTIHEIDQFRSSLLFDKAEQTADLSWPAFMDAINNPLSISLNGDESNGGGSTDVQIYTGNNQPTKANCFMPVSPKNYALTYSGASTLTLSSNDGDGLSGEETDPQPQAEAVSHTITGIVVDNKDAEGIAAITAGGLFGAPEKALTVSDLELIDFSVTLASGDAGALAGALADGSSVKNVAAYNSDIDAGVQSTATGIETGSGSAGGLVGSMTSNTAGSTVEKCAASLFVRATAGNAGGLVGKATNGGVVRYSYSGGHTFPGTARYSSENINVTASGIAGGLVGDAGKAEITGCYSTCSATGAMAGGLIGKADDSAGAVVKNCYAAGRVVKGGGATDRAGAFMGGGKLGGASANDYYIGSSSPGLASGETVADSADPIVRVFGANSTLYKNCATEGMLPLPNYLPDGQTEAVDNRAEALRYDPALPERFAYLTVAQLKDSPVTDDDPEYLREHYGDWQSAELDTNLFIENRELLTANVTIPRNQFYDGAEITVLIKGRTSEQYAWLVLSVNREDDAVTLQQPVSGIYAASEAGGLLEKVQSLPDTWPADALVSVQDVSAANPDAPASESDPDENVLVRLRVNLDNITGVDDGDASTDDNRGHFTQLFPRFIPGEDLIVVAASDLTSINELRAVADDDTRASWTKTLQTDASGNAGVAAADQGNAGPTTDAAADSEAATNAEVSDAPAEEASANGAPSANGDSGTATAPLTLADETNSLFADPASAAGNADGDSQGAAATNAGGASTAATAGSKVSEGIAAIDNLRHFENLDARISRLSLNSAAGKSIAIRTAKQIRQELVWELEESEDSFLAVVKALKSAARIHVYPMDGTPSKADCFLPVSPSACAQSGSAYRYTPSALAYAPELDGAVMGGVTGIRVDTDAAIEDDIDEGEYKLCAGLFGELISGSSVTNLTLTSFEITAGKGATSAATTAYRAGALAGSLAGTGAGTAGVTVTNIEVLDSTVNTKTRSGVAGGLVGSAAHATIINALARNTDAFDSDTAATVESGTDAGDTSTGGSAGGLVGSMTDSTVEKSAAALIVRAAAGDAGGLAGYAGDSEITASYAGGHTARPSTGAVSYSDTAFNVTAAAGSAGGLVGVAEGTEFEHSYSTCSASGAKAGGFVGDASGSTLTNCYATGRVKGVGSGSVEGAFAGGYESCAAADCLYFEIVNEDEETLECMTGLGDGQDDDGIAPLDQSAESYDRFSGSAWNAAVPYNARLIDYYGANGAGRYNLRTVPQLDAQGDYNSTASDANPVVDFVTTHYGDWPAPELFVLNLAQGS